MKWDESGTGRDESGTGGDESAAQGAAPPRLRPFPATPSGQPSATRSAQRPKGGITIAFNACLDGTPLAKCLRQALPARSRRRILARYGLD